MSHHDPHQPTVALDAKPDAWHMHTPEEGLPQEEHGAYANPVVLVVAFVATVTFVGGLILITILYFRAHTIELRRQRIETTALAGPFFEYRDGAQKKLGTYGWAGPEAAAAGHVSIPIDVAMQRIVQEYAGAGGRAEGSR